MISTLRYTRAVSKLTLSILLIMIDTTFCVSSQIDAAEKFTLDVFLPKTTFLKGEYIYASIVLKNTAGQTISIPTLNHFTGGLKLFAVDKNGKQLKNTFPIFEGDEDIVQLPPDSSVTAYVELSSILGNDPRTRSRQRAFLVGTYHVAAVLQGDTSTFVSFSIGDPSDEEKIVYEKLTDGLVSSRGNKKIQLAEEMIQSYGQSVYLPNIYLQLLNALDLFDQTPDGSKKLKDLSYTFIERFPDSPFTRNALYYFSSAIQKMLATEEDYRSPKDRKAELNRELKKLQSKFSNHKVSQFVDDYSSAQTIER